MKEAGTMNESNETRSIRREEEMVQIINFTIGGDEYAVDIKAVREVINFHEITLVPKAPRFIKGIINLRGEVIPVIDLRERFGLEQTAYSALTNIIIVEIAKKPLGVVVDSVSHVLRLAQSEIASPPPLIGGLSGKYVVGVAKMKDRLIVILNMDRILSTDEVIELQDMDLLLSQSESPEQGKEEEQDEQEHEKDEQEKDEQEIEEQEIDEQVVNEQEIDDQIEEQEQEENE